MTQLRQSVEQYIERCADALDQMFIAIETRNTADAHVALAALLGLLEMLKSESLHGDDAEE
jgi:hypothetical protein